MSSQSRNNVVSATAAAINTSDVLKKMGGSDMFYGAALPPDVPDNYVSLNEPNRSPPGCYLFPKVMGKDKDGAGEMGLAIRQFYFLKYKLTQAYILSKNGEAKYKRFTMAVST